VLSCAECPTLGKEAHCREPNFTECGSRQSLLCRVPNKRHSAKRPTLGKASDSGSEYFRSITTLDFYKSITFREHESIADHISLPESVALRTFTECHTRQSPALGNERVYREQDSRYKITLSKDIFAERQTLGEGGTRQRTVSSRL
jgi:hypothetical protein